MDFIKMMAEEQVKNEEEKAKTETRKASLGWTKEDDLLADTIRDNYQTERELFSAALGEYAPTIEKTVSLLIRAFRCMPEFVAKSFTKSFVISQKMLIEDFEQQVISHFEKKKKPAETEEVLN